MKANCVAKKSQQSATHFIWQQRVLFLIVVGAVTLSGCATDTVPIHLKDGKEYGRIDEAFRNRWWHYYKRGISFAEGEFYKNAEADMKEAARRRSKDQRMARTYGMHFVDYFPHRELGVIYYHSGNMERAREELELSLSHFSSAKARFYLDRVRKAMIEAEGKEISPPSLSLDFETDDVWTREDPVVLSGVAADENYISAIVIKGATPVSDIFNALYSEGSRKEVAFKKFLLLSQGDHELELSARNLPGKVARKKLILHVDREGPTIVIEEIEVAREAIRLSGSLHDEAGISKLSINGRPVTVQGKNAFFFTETVRPDVGEVELMALDRLGNQTAARVPLQDQPLVSESGGRMLAVAEPDMADFFVASFFGSTDKVPPAIELKGWNDSQTVFMEKIYLEGKISDESQIIRVSVNGTPILRRKGRYVFFGHLAELEPGENEILIQAEDAAGNAAERKISVDRKVPKALQLSERLSISVLPFDQSGEVSQFSTSFQDNLISALVNQNRFRIIERDKLDALLQEQKLSRTKLIDRETALKLGRLIAARSVLYGNIVETRTGIEIVARLIDTETAEILATQDVYDEVKDLIASRALSQGLAVKLHREFPLIDGLVVQQKENYIFIDLGERLVKLQRRFIVYREEPITHPVTGKMLGSDNQIMGRARVTQVMPELSKAELLGGKTASIKPLDRVIAE